LQLSFLEQLDRAAFYEDLDQEVYLFTRLQVNFEYVPFQVVEAR